ncbi:hypothetical protein N0V90_002262 [Kalmusia sp. IMI 367209]|nr:hypothetical protein N0V90_002262 [Kalmusia sp. IMI 367209]
MPSPRSLGTAQTVPSGQSAKALGKNKALELPHTDFPSDVLNVEDDTINASEIEEARLGPWYFSLGTNTGSDNPVIMVIRWSSRPSFTEGQPRLTNKQIAEKVKELALYQWHQYKAAHPQDLRDEKDVIEYIDAKDFSEPRKNFGIMLISDNLTQKPKQIQKITQIGQDALNSLD